MDKYQRDVHHLRSIGVFKPTPPPRPTLDGYPFELRCRLLLEEAYEFVRACGYEVRGLLPESNGHPFQVRFSRIADPDWPAMIDAIVDVGVVDLGAAVSMGVDLDPFWDEVQRANADKVNGELREDGKRLKPAGWTPPDILGVLDRVLGQPVLGDRDGVVMRDDAPRVESSIEPSVGVPQIVTLTQIDVIAANLTRREHQIMALCDIVGVDAEEELEDRVREMKGMVDQYLGDLRAMPHGPSRDKPGAEEVFVPQVGAIDFDTARITPVDATPTEMANAGIISFELAALMERTSSMTVESIGVLAAGAATKLIASGADPLGRPPSASMIVESIDFHPTEQKMAVGLAAKSPLSPPPSPPGVKYDVANPTQTISVSTDSAISVIAMQIRERPLTTEDISNRTGIDGDVVRRLIDEMIRRGIVVEARDGGRWVLP